MSIEKRFLSKPRLRRISSYLETRKDSIKIQSLYFGLLAGAYLGFTQVSKLIDPLRTFLEAQTKLSNADVERATIFFSGASIILPVALLGYVSYNLSEYMVNKAISICNMRFAKG